MLHLEQLKEEIAALGARAAERYQQRASESGIARRWLGEAPPPAILRVMTQSVEQKEVIAQLPTDAPLTERRRASSPPPGGSVVIGVDGSQIAPDRHAAVLYYLLQSGGVIFTYNGQAPQTAHAAGLHFEEHELFDAEGLLITSQLGMRRMVAELEFLAQLTERARAAGAPTPILALTDGPLLWPYSGRSDEERQGIIERYLAACDRIRELGGMPVGYTERPGGRLLIELLWLTRLSSAGTPIHTGEAPLQTVSDQELMAHFLQPGERSVWFTRDSAMNERHTRAGHGIWFCYINVGAVGYPVIARLETPEWAAQRELWVETLHSVLVHQAGLLQGNPYVLARAHEEALVTHQDKAALEAQLQQQLLARGFSARESEKARQKSYLGKR